MEESVVERLSFAYREVDQINPRIVQKFGHTVKELDLSNNNIQDLSPLKGFTKLHILVLDGNKITEHTKFPPLEKLHTLWVNNNNIANLIIFIDKLVENTPNLKFLSMLKNEACPNFFNGRSLKEYNDYRCYVISRLPGLTTLDSTPITNAERAEGDRLYSTIAPPTTSVASPIVNRPVFYATGSSDAIQAPTNSIEKGKKKKRTKKPPLTETKKIENNNAANTILPDFSLDTTGSNIAPPPVPSPNMDNFDDSSDSSSWSDEEWGDT